MRAAIYERISQDKTGEAAGVTRQDEDCRALAADLGWQVVEIYVDNDVSATSGKPRPAYRRLLADIEADRIDGIICWHTDRLYRTVLDIEELVSVVEAHKVAIRTCRAGELDLSTPTGRMVSRILGSVAQHEVEQKADRWQRSVRQRRQAGKWWNSALRMFGYTRDGEVIPEEADALRKVTDMILSGSTSHAACQWLQDEGIKTTRGNDWQPSSLRVTLRSPKIAALSALDGQIIGPGEWEPILDRATWERLVAALDSRGRRLVTPPRRALLTGLISCGVDGCGRKLRRGKSGGRRGEAGYAVYRCGTELKASGHVSVKAIPVEKMVEAAARAALADDDVRKAVTARLSTAGTSAATLTKEIDEIEGELGLLDAAMRGAESARSKLSITGAIDDLDTQLQEKRAQLSALTPVALPVGDEWPDDMARRSALIRVVVERVVIHPALRQGGSFDSNRVDITPVQQTQVDQVG